jgi:hypothetical protein
MNVWTNHIYTDRMGEKHPAAIQAESGGCASPAGAAPRSPPGASPAAPRLSARVVRRDPVEALENHGVYSLNLQNLQVTLNVPLRSKSGAIAPSTIAWH